jgi:ASC-1-like (ASCH) protein
MVLYKKKKVNDGSRYYYYKEYADGMKKMISKEVYDRFHTKHKGGAMEPVFREHLSEPWFTLISLGLKTVEGRLNKGRFHDLKEGDIIEWWNDDFAMRQVRTQVTGKAVYPSFAAYLETEGLQQCLPGMPTLDHGLSVYYKYFTKEKEAEFGVIAIRLKVIA